MESTFFLQLTLNGVLLGGFYALMSAGFSLGWRATGVINLAHGEFMLLGAYLAWSLFNREQTSNSGAILAVLFPAAVILAGGVLFILGFVLQRYLFNHIAQSDLSRGLLLTLALKIILVNVGLALYGSDPRLPALPNAGSYWRIGQSDITLAEAPVYALITAAIVLAAALALRRIRIGKAIRAAAQNPIAAQLVGISLQRIYAIAFGLALALTGAAGALLATLQPFSPDSGTAWTLRAAAVVMLGGLNRLENLLSAALIIGLAESYSGGYLGTGWAAAIPFFALVVRLILRPPATYDLLLKGSV